METKGKSWREQLAAIESRLQGYEAEAQKRIGELVARGGASRKELEELLARVRSGELLGQAAQLRARAESTGNEVLKRFEGLPERTFEKLGLATRPQLDELNEQVARLGRKLDRISRQAARWTAAASTRGRNSSAREGGGEEKPVA